MSELPIVPDTGEVTADIKGKKCDVEWKLNFNSLPKEISNFYWSPCFYFQGESWYFVIWPYGNNDRDSLGYMDLYFSQNTSNGPPLTMKVSLALKSVNGHEDLERSCMVLFKGKGSRYYIHRLISISDFQKRKSEFLTSGFLTIVCKLRILNTTGNINDIENAVCSYCNKTFYADEISVHEEKCRIKCPDCSNIVPYENWYVHECQVPGTGDENSLCEDLKEMLLNDVNHDLFLMVGDKELRAHKNILGARSHVFKSMLSHDMKEKNSGIINIPDCDPQAMEQFLCYIYTGKVDSYEQCNMLKVYYIADKYDVKGLKAICRIFIKKSLSISNVCDVLKLALNHTDSSLLEYATEYFMNNALDIMRTVEWQSFMKDNLIAANELTLKSVEKLKLQVHELEEKGKR